MENNQDYNNDFNNNFNDNFNDNYNVDNNSNNNDDFNDNFQENKSNKKYLVVYLTLLVVGLLFVGLAGAYAFFTVSTSGNNTNTTGNVSLDCINLTYSESDIINLTNQYPISETYALTLKPVTATITNSCNNSVPYTLALSTLKTASGYISDAKIDVNVKRKLGSATETTLITTKKVSTLTSLTGNQLTYLTSHLSDTKFSTYTTKTPYIIDSSQTISKNTTNTYRIYLWVDHAEGGTNNSTENQKFAATLSLIVG